MAAFTSLQWSKIAEAMANNTTEKKPVQNSDGPFFGDFMLGKRPCLA